MPVVKKGSLVAVTGASGFVGSHVVKCLLEQGYKVRAVVRDATNEAKTKFLKDLAAQLNVVENISFASGNLLIKDSYDAAFENVDAVVHAAAVVDIMSPKNAQKEVVDPSVVGVNNVLSSIGKQSSVKRLIHTSSIAAIQRVNEKDGFKFTDKDWNTYSSIENGDAYGYAKRLAEELVKKQVEENKKLTYDAVVINPGIVLGECLAKAHTKASPVLLRQALYGNSVTPINGVYVDVRDVALAHVNALTLDLKSKSFSRFILVSDEPAVNTLELAPRAQKLFPKYKLSSTPAYNPYVLSTLWYISALPVVGGFFLSEFHRETIYKHFEFDNSNTKKELGIKFHSLDDMIRATIDSMVDKDFIKPRPKL